MPLRTLSPKPQGRGQHQAGFCPTHTDAADGTTDHKSGPSGGELSGDGWLGFLPTHSVSPLGTKCFFPFPPSSAPLRNPMPHNYA